jgi:hypothetical protein
MIDQQRAEKAVTYRVLIRNNETGEERLYAETYPWHDAAQFLWTEGNYGCDCNRAIFFADAGGEGDIDIDCGDSRFSALYAEFPNGTRIQLDGQE